MGGYLSVVLEAFRKRVFSDLTVIIKSKSQGFPGGSVVKNRPANAGDRGLIPGSERPHMPQSNRARVPPLLSLGSRVCALQKEKLSHRYEE